MVLSGYDEQKRMIADRIKRVNSSRNDMTKRENKILSSIQDLQKQVDEIIK